MFNLSSMMPQGSLPELAETVRRMLSSAQAQISAAWNAQHNDNGTHKDVTATSLRTQHFGVSGSILKIDARNGVIIGEPLRVPRGVSFVSIITTNVASTVVIKGIQQDGVRYGDFLFLRRDPLGVDDIEIEDSSSSVPQNTYIHVPQEVSASWPAFFIQRTSWLPLMYAPSVGSTPAGFASSDGWVIPQWVSL